MRITPTRFYTTIIPGPESVCNYAFFRRATVTRHPRLAGHGPTLFEGLSKRIDLKLVNRLEFISVAMRYEPRR